MKEKESLINPIRFGSYLLIKKKKNCKPVSIHLGKLKFERKSETYLFSEDHQVGK